MAMSGLSCSHEEVDAENGPTAFPCCVVLSVDGSDGCGTPKITYGPRSIPNSRRDGSMWMLVRRHGILLGYTVRVSLVTRGLVW